MTKNKEDWTSISFDSDWKCYYQQLNDKTDEKTIISNVNIDQCWSAVELPHVTDVVKYSCKWWYRKQFDWTTINLPSEQQVYLHFEPSNNHDKKFDINAMIWLNGAKIFSGLLSSTKDSIKLSSELFHRENILIICCLNNHLSLHTCLRIHGKVICATGEMTIDEKQTNTLDYTVSIGDDDERFDVIFNQKRKSKSIPTASTRSFELAHNENEINEEKENDLLVPRLAIVILIVGTRGDVQPFIA
jgi:hypothetical protein